MFFKNIILFHWLTYFCNLYIFVLIPCTCLYLFLVVQEAVATGDPELLQLVLERRDVQRYSSRMAGIPELLRKLKDAPDFYVEMKWEFTSWGNVLCKM